MFRLLGTLIVAAVLTFPSEAQCQLRDPAFERSERVAAQILGATAGSVAGLFGGFLVGVPLYHATGQPFGLLTAPVAATLLAAAGADIGGRGEVAHGTSLGAAIIGGLAAGTALVTMGRGGSHWGHWVLAWAIPQGVITGLLADRGLPPLGGPLVPPH